MRKNDTWDWMEVAVGGSFALVPFLVLLVALVA